MTPASIEKIFVFATRRTGSATACDRVMLVAGKGIVGDRYFGKRDQPGRNLTLIEAEQLEDFEREFERQDPWWLSRRNLVTRGIRLNALVGREFRIGDVRLLGVELCEPCKLMGNAYASAAHDDRGTMTPAMLIRRFTHRAGLRAKIITGGVIAIGSGIEIIEPASSPSSASTT